MILSETGKLLITFYIGLFLLMGIGVFEIHLFTKDYSVRWWLLSIYCVVWAILVLYKIWG